MVNGSYLFALNAHVYIKYNMRYITYHRTTCDAKEIDVLSKWTKRVRQQQQQTQLVSLTYSISTRLNP